MIANKKILAIIPARGGSKGVPRKNIKLLAGKPLIAWSIEAAKQSRYIDDVIVSSEDEEILKVAKEYGASVPFVRPLELAQDDTPGIAPVMHAIEQCTGYDYIILLQPTSPLRTVTHIDESIALLMNQQQKSLVSVCEAEQSPYWMYYVDEKNTMAKVIATNEIVARRQDAPKVYLLNGAIYISEITYLKQQQSLVTENSLAYIMPKNQSYDIDTAVDFLICKHILEGDSEI